MRVPLVGVVTALGRCEYNLLAEAGSSVADLNAMLAADGVDYPLEWVICCDGDASPAAVRHTLGELTVRVTVVTTPRRSGPGPARNRALMEVSAPYVITLDSDDRLVPCGMRLLLAALRNDTAAAWSAGRCYHVDAAGALRWVGPSDPWPPGRVAPGAFWAHKRRVGGLPFLCTATVARTAAIRACGGWPRGQRLRAEDTALWAVLTSRFSGIWIAEHAYDYRRHSGSLTHTPGFRKLDEQHQEIEAMIAAGTTVLPRRT